MNSKPEELEKIDRKLALLKMEASALQKEKDKTSLLRLNDIKTSIKAIEESKTSLESQ
jgi:ATP-dependent Clp protease ATP-binding subunit ClpA